MGLLSIAESLIGLFSPDKLLNLTFCFPTSIFIVPPPPTKNKRSRVPSPISKNQNLCRNTVWETVCTRNSVCTGKASDNNGPVVSSVLASRYIAHIPIFQQYPIPISKLNGGECNIYTSQCNSVILLMEHPCTWSSFYTNWNIYNHMSSQMIWYIHLNNFNWQQFGNILREW